MPPPTTARRRRRLLGCMVALGALTGLLAAAPVARAQAPGNVYRQTNLVSDIAGVARLTDRNLVNPWGLAAGPATPAWVADNGTDVATVYSGGVNGSLPVLRLTVNIPAGGAPTGQVFNGTDGFVVHSGSASGPALFIFDSEAGTITGWSPAVPPPAPSTQAQPAAAVKGAIFKGLAIASVGDRTFLYAADFHNAKIDVFNSRFKRTHLAGSFNDHGVPDGFAPFNIQELGGRLYVAYAKQDADAEDEVAGAGLGFVNVFDTSGRFLHRVAARGALNAPWGLALAPQGFGAFSGDLLVGNFGDGRISAYDPATGSFLGQLANEDGAPITIDGLWALRFGNGVTGSPTDLLFTAGIADEEHGLFGSIAAVG
ncbi:MAG TPA: TIGR03118 family protein [Actinomycetes bacterium]|nr:TIGR03118 family protein [Actinomycetes bacterium]